MDTIRTVDPKILDLLHQLLSAATHDASAAMCKWTNGVISLSLDQVIAIPMDEVSAELQFQGDLRAMVVLSLAGDLGGEMILSFNRRDGRRLAATLLNQPAEESDEWSEMEKSALCETGNILGCAYLNALTRLIGSELVPSPPQFVWDYGESVIEQALVPQAMTSDSALICRTGFHCAGRQLDWNVFFFPTETMRLAMESALD